MSSREMKIETVEVVEVYTPKVTVENDMCGGKAIKLDDFIYVQINYDYCYTSNSARSDLCDHVLAYLGVDPKSVSQTSKGLHMPTLEEIDIQIAALVETRNWLMKKDLQK